MTKQQAINAMRAGDKVTHITFLDDEYITLVHNHVVDEQGYTLPDFWKKRTGAIKISVHYNGF